MTARNHNRGLLWAGIALFASLCVGALLYLTLPDQAYMNSAVATTVPVTCLIVCFMFVRSSISDATFIFMLWAFVYQVVEPWLLVTGTAQVTGGQFFLDNYRLLALGNLYFTAGLVAYGLGILLCPRSRARGPGRLLKTRAEGNEVMWVLLAVSLLSWGVMWLRAGAPRDALLLIRPSEITRNQQYVAYGYGYLLAFAFGTNIAVLVYAIFHPTKSIFSAKMLGLMACVLLLNNLSGSRLIFFLAPISVLLLKYLLSGGQIAGARARRQHPGLALAVGSVLCLVLALPYTEYREGDAAQPELRRFGWGTMLANDAGTLFWESLTYYMVLDRVPSEYSFWHGRSYAAPFILAIPRVIFPDKVSYLWNDRQFVLDFFGYDEWEFGATAKGGGLLAYQYLNFGTAGIVAEMFVLGMLNEFLSRKARSQFTSNFFRVVYVFYISYVLLILWKNGFANAVNFAEVSLIELWGITWSVALVRRKIATISKKGLGTGRTERPPSLFWTDKAFPERSAIDG